MRLTYQPPKDGLAPKTVMETKDGWEFCFPHHPWYRELRVRDLDTDAKWALMFYESHHLTCWDGACLPKCSDAVRERFFEEIPKYLRTLVGADYPFDFS